MTWNKILFSKNSTHLWKKRGSAVLTWMRPFCQHQSPGQNHFQQAVHLIHRRHANMIPPLPEKAVSNLAPPTKIFEEVCNGHWDKLGWEVQDTTWINKNKATHCLHSRSCSLANHCQQVPLQCSLSMPSFTKIGWHLWQKCGAQYTASMCTKQFQTMPQTYTRRLTRNPTLQVEHLCPKYTKVYNVTWCLFDMWTKHTVNLLHADTLHVLTATTINVTVLIHSCRKRIIFPVFLR